MVLTNRNEKENNFMGNSGCWRINLEMFYAQAFLADCSPAVWLAPSECSSGWGWATEGVICYSSGGSSQPAHFPQLHIPPPSQWHDE